MIPQNQRDYLINRIVDKLTEFIFLDYDVKLPSALNMVYQSNVYQLLIKDDGYLYTQSPSYIYELLKPEIKDFWFLNTKLLRWN